MKKRTLTDKFIRGLREPCEVTDAKTTGLAFRVWPSGFKTWRFRYRSPEVTKDGAKVLRSASLGEYAPGREDSVGLAEARDRAEAYRRAIRDGVDPVEQDKRERRVAEVERAATVRRLGERFVAEYAKPRKKSWKEDKRQLASFVYPAWGDRPAREITRADVRALVAVKARDAPVAANRLHALLSRLFNWACEQDVVDASPVAGTKAPTKETSRQRVLTDDEVKAFWSATEPRDLDDPDDERMTPSMSAFWRLRLVTAQRAVEVAGMRWRELDLESGWWTIPPERSKNGESHRVYLTDLARDVVATCPRVKGDPHVLVGARGKRAQRAARRKLALDDFRGHDLRRTAATIMGNVGVDWFAIGRVLNHEPPRGSTAVYVRSTFDREKRAALESLERRLRAIVKGEARGAEVIPLARSA